MVLIKEIASWIFWMFVSAFLAIVLVLDLILIIFDPFYKPVTEQAGGKTEVVDVYKSLLSCIITTSIWSSVSFCLRNSLN